MTAEMVKWGFHYPWCHHLVIHFFIRAQFLFFDVKNIPRWTRGSVTKWEWQEQIFYKTLILPQQYSQSSALTMTKLWQEWRVILVSCLFSFMCFSKFLSLQIQKQCACRQWSCSLNLIPSIQITFFASDAGTCDSVSSSTTCGDDASSYYTSFTYNGKRVIISNQVVVTVLDGREYLKNALHVHL